MFPLKEIIRSQSKMYALSRAVDRSAYLIAPMPTSSRDRVEVEALVVALDLVEDRAGPLRRPR